MKTEIPHIRRSDIEAVEVAENRYVFNIGARAVKAVETPVRSPQTHVDVEPDVPTHYKEPSLRQKFVDYMDTAWMREFDARNGTDLYGEYKERKLAEKVLVARQVAGLDKPPVWSKHKRALALAQQALKE